MNQQNQTPLRLTQSKTKNKTSNKTKKHWLFKVVFIIVIGIILYFFINIIRSVIFFFPLPIIDSDFGAYHVYDKSTLAAVLQQIPIQNPVIGTSYSGNCGYQRNELPILGYINCQSSYTVLYKGTGDLCVDYNSTYDAMKKEGYKYDSGTILSITDSKEGVESLPGGLSNLTLSNQQGFNDCQVLSYKGFGGFAPSYISKTLTKLGYGHGYISCFYPAYVPGVNENENYYVTAKNFNCTIEIDTAQE